MKHGSSHDRRDPLCELNTQSASKIELGIASGTLEFRKSGSGINPSSERHCALLSNTNDAVRIGPRRETNDADRSDVALPWSEAKALKALWLRPPPDLQASTGEPLVGCSVAERVRIGPQFDAVSSAPPYLTSAPATARSRRL
jgi:hypothetical protein